MGGRVWLVQELCKAILKSIGFSKYSGYCDMNYQRVDEHNTFVSKIVCCSVYRLQL